MLCKHTAASYLILPFDSVKRCSRKAVKCKGVLFYCPFTRAQSCSGKVSNMWHCAHRKTYFSVMFRQITSNTNVWSEHFGSGFCVAWRGWQQMPALLDHVENSFPFESIWLFSLYFFVLNMWWLDEHSITQRVEHWTTSVWYLVWNNENLNFWCWNV